MASLHAGWDIVHTPCEHHLTMKCRTCGQFMDVKRGVEGPTSYAESLANKGHLHDVFTCKSAGKKWHKQVRRLREEIEATPSAKLAAIYLEEIEEIIKKKKATKEVNDLF